MSRGRCVVHCLLLVSTACFLVGCSQSVETTAPVTSAIATPPTPEAPADATLAQASPEDDKSSDDVEPGGSVYRAPFPNRQNLFSPVRRAPLAKRGDRETGSSVELMGFANVDGQKVLLAIDGIMTPLAAGTERYGVRVISIQPPEAVLQRGRNRWTASLQ